MNVRYIFSHPPITGVLHVEYGAQSGLGVFENIDVLQRAYFVGETEVVEDPDEAIRRLLEPYLDPSIQALLSTLVEAEVTAIDSSSIVLVDPTEYWRRRIAYEVETDEPRLLVIGEVHDSTGWTGTLNGNRVPIHQADYLLRAVAELSGKYTLQMAFNPARYDWR